LIWLLFANFGSYIIKRVDKNAKAQQRDDKVSKKSYNKEEKE
jgi:hypothetical protein